MLALNTLAQYYFNQQFNWKRDFFIWGHGTIRGDALTQNTPQPGFLGTTSYFFNGDCKMLTVPAASVTVRVDAEINLCLTTSVPEHSPHEKTI